MKPHIKLLICSTFLLFGNQLYAQTDSTRFVHANWTIRKIAKGIVLKQLNIADSSLFKANQVISMLDIKLKRRYQLAVGYEPSERKLTSTFGKEAKAIAAINGTFFDVKNGGSVDFLKVDGIVINENCKEANGKRAMHQKAAITIDGKKINILNWDGTASWEHSLKASTVMLTGPLLLQNYQQVKLDSSAFNKTRHPRAAFAIGKNKHIILLTVDGRDSHSAGMDLFELSSIFRWMKTKDAINLDGGGSTTLWVNGESENGVVNFPSDNKVWDHQGERPVANVLLLRKRK